MSGTIRLRLVTVIELKSESVFIYPQEMIVKAYKFKMIPCVAQRTNFSQFFGPSRFIYNCALDLKIGAYKNDKLKLSDRMWKGPNCNSVLDRYVNAAINIRNMGLEKYKIHPEGTGGEDAETQESLVVKRQCSV